MILPALLLVAASAASVGSAPPVDPALYAGMKCRSIGPFRGGRVVAVAGVPGDPATYWFGGVAGGVFKSEDGGIGVDRGQRRGARRAAVSRQLDDQFAKWKAVSSTDVPALDQKIRALALPSLTVGTGAPASLPASAPQPSRRQRDQDERRR